MSGFDYARSRATADRLIGRFGQAGLLRVPGATTGPAHNPTPGVPVDHSVTLVVLDYSDSELNEGRVRSTDKKVLLAKKSLTVEPKLEHLLRIGGVWHAIVGPDVGRGIRTIAPGGIVVCWELQARA